MRSTGRVLSVYSKLQHAVADRAVRPRHAVQIRTHPVRPYQRPGSAKHRFPPRCSVAVMVPMLLLAACASEPLGPARWVRHAGSGTLGPARWVRHAGSGTLGPAVGAMPQPGKPFDVFQGDQALCMQFASGEVQEGAQQANNQPVGTGHIVSTLLGAGLGAAIGGGRGAAEGRQAVPGRAPRAARRSGPAHRKTRRTACNSVTTWPIPSACTHAGTRSPGINPPPRLLLRRGIIRRPRRAVTADPGVAEISRLRCIEVMRPPVSPP